MIEIKINNYEQIAESRSFMAKLLPRSMLQKIVYKTVAKQLHEKLLDQGVNATVTVINDKR